MLVAHPLKIGFSSQAAFAFEFYAESYLQSRCIGAGRLMDIEDWGEWYGFAKNCWKIAVCIEVIYSWHDEDTTSNVTRGEVRSNTA